MNRIAIAVAAIFSVTTIVFAQSENPVADRQALMKATAGASGQAARMLKGQDPFDSATAAAVFKQMKETADRGPGLFPAGSDKGQTRALPAIWEKKDDFDAIFAKMGAAAEAGLQKTGSLDEFKEAFGAVAQNCGACHQPYRAPQ